MNKFAGRKGTISYLTPLMNNKSAVFHSGYDKGARVIGDLFDDNNVFLSFAQVQNSFGGNFFCLSSSPPLCQHKYQANTG